jgi:hypothetical protein
MLSLVDRKSGGPMISNSEFLSALPINRENQLECMIMLQKRTP